MDNEYFEYLSMPFGFKTAPAIFQRSKCLLPNLHGRRHNIRNFPSGTNGDFKNQRLRYTHYKVYLKKSEFLKGEVGFLSYLTTSEGVMYNPQKISAIIKYPIPKRTTD